jgi:flagellar biosynthesis GTPase FlhF
VGATVVFRVFWCVFFASPMCAQFVRFIHTSLVDSYGRPRPVDCLLLTKFDQIEERVGAAVSMVHQTGIPVALVGVGQRYPDIRRLNADAVVSALLAESKSG